MKFSILLIAATAITVSASPTSQGSWGGGRTFFRKVEKKEDTPDVTSRRKSGGSAKVKAVSIKKTVRMDKKKSDDGCEEHHWGLPYMHCCEDIEDAFDGFE